MFYVQTLYPVYLFLFITPHHLLNFVWSWSLFDNSRDKRHQWVLWSCWMWCYTVGSIFCHCQGIQDHFGLLYVVCVIMQQWCVACILWHLDHRHSVIACYMMHNSVSCRAAFQAHSQSIQPLEWFYNTPNSPWKCTYLCVHTFFLCNGNIELFRVRRVLNL